MADYYLHKTAAHIDELLEKVEGLDNYDDTEVRGLINNKVDKEIGKGLSTNDFTDAYKTELDGLDTALNGKVDKEIGKGLSTNDFTDAYKEALDGLDTALGSKVDKETGKGLSTNDFADAYKEALDGLDTALGSKVDKETGKGLSTNDFTTEEKTKLAGIESGAQVNIQVDWNQTDTTADDYIKNKPNIPSGVVVDTTYDATSQNAQAGTAVAQAVSTKVDKVTGKGLSTNDYTTAEKDKLAGIASGAEVNVQSDWSQSDSTADDYIKNKPTITDVNDATLTIQKNDTAVGTFSANAATAATINITVPVDATDVSALPDTTKYGASMVLSIDSSTYVVTATLKDQNGNTLGTVQTIDLPLETVVVGGSYDDTTKKVILTLKNGNTIDFSVADLVAGLQTEITSTNKLDADLVDDTTSVHKFVTAADKTAWNAKSDFSGSYNDLTDKPTIPAAQVNANWNATSGVARILNKPTIYTKPEVDTALAAKLNKSDVDDALSSTSTNPVQNKAVQAPIARLVDAGAKNLLNLGTGEINPSVTTRGVTWTKDILTGAVIANGTSESGGSYPSISAITLKPGTYFMCGGTQRIVLMETSTNARDYGNGVSFTVTNNTAQPIQILAIANANMTFNDEVIHPMVCSPEDYAVSPTIQPYVPTNLELYEMILALQNAQNGG